MVCVRNIRILRHPRRQEILGRYKLIYKMAIEFLDVLCEIGNTLHCRSDEAVYPEVIGIAICNFSASL